MDRGALFKALGMALALSLGCVPEIPSAEHFACAAGGACDAGQDAPDRPALSLDAASSVDGAAATGCARYGANALCNDFEDAGALAGSWHLTGDGEVAVDRTHGGGASLLLAPPAPDGTRWLFSQLRTSSTAALSPLKDLYIRAWVYLESAPRGDATLQLVQVMRQSFQVIAVVLTSSSVKVWNGVAQSIAENRTLGLPIGRWACWELADVMTGTTTSWSLSLDGASVLEAKQETQSGFDSVRVGVYLPPAPVQPQIRAWIDDVVISDGPIGCP